MKRNVDPRFQRQIHAQPNTYSSYLRITYKPVGFWANEVITLNFEFEEVKGRRTSDLMAGGLCVNYSLKHSGGGQEEKIDPITTAQNFVAAYQDAVDVANGIIGMIKSGVEYEELAKFMMRLDMEQDTVESAMSSNEKKAVIVIAKIGGEKDETVAAHNKLWVSVDEAKNGLLTVAKEVEFIVREASHLEKHYWWTMFHSYKTPIIGYVEDQA